MNYNEKFNMKISLLVDYFILNKCEPSSSEIYKGVRLGAFNTLIKSIYKKGKIQEDGSIKYRGEILSKYHIDRLNEVNYTWDNNVRKKRTNYVNKPQKNNWEINYILLYKFIEEKNRFPKRDEPYQNKNIGNWLLTQKKIYNNGVHLEDGSIRYKNLLLTKDQINKLESLHISWQPKSKEEKWYETKQSLTKRNHLLKP